MNKTHDKAKPEAKDKMPPLGPMTKEETQRYYRLWNQLAGLLTDCTPEELAAFDSTLRHPPPPEKFEHKS